MLLDFTSASVEFIKGLEAVTSRYDGFLVDAWGVLHDGTRPYPGVIDCLWRLKEQEKKIIIVSNAARRAALLEKEFMALGLAPEHYDRIISSGEVAWHAFSSGENVLVSALGKRYYLFGPASYRLLDDLPLRKTDDIEAADFILTIGLPESQALTESEDAILQLAQAKGLTMVCANPDLQVMRNGKLGIAPGAIAARYESCKGDVIYFGKPYAEIYQHSLKALSEIDPERILAVGDALNTDIAGANGCGLNSLLITGGIYADKLHGMPENYQDLASLCQTHKQYPTLVATGFFW